VTAGHYYRKKTIAKENELLNNKAGTFIFFRGNYSMNLVTKKIIIRYTC